MRLPGGCQDLAGKEVGTWLAEPCKPLPFPFLRQAQEQKLVLIVAVETPVLSDARCSALSPSRSGEGACKTLQQVIQHLVTTDQVLAWF